jgi:hypothetical protein
MIGFSIHPQVYNAGPFKGLLNMLEVAWVRNIQPGNGKFFIVSGFANYNGGVRFYDIFRKHISRGGKVIAYLGGSTSQRLSSKQVVKELLDCGVEVYIINRKRILHVKCYGGSNDSDQSLIVTSGNFTGPGMSQNVEASILLDKSILNSINFSWDDLIESFYKQNWAIYKPSLQNMSDPSWKLLYDEFETEILLDNSQEVSMVLILSNADTARIQANKGTKASLGTQYFWLSKSCYDFFPPLTIRNIKGYKATYSTIITLNYIDLGIVDKNTRVTFEAENNLDFRLGTSKLRYTKLVKSGDLAVISRIKEHYYELRLFKKDNHNFDVLRKYAINFIGHRGKKYGYTSNEDIFNIVRNENSQYSIPIFNNSD